MSHLKWMRPVGLFGIFPVLVVVAIVHWPQTGHRASPALIAMLALIAALQTLGLGLYYRRCRRAEKTARTRQSGLAQALDLSPVATLIADADRRILYVNKRYCQLVGQPREALLHQAMDLAHLERRSPRELEKMARQLEAGRAWQGEGRLPGRKGQQPVLTTVQPIADGRGRAHQTLVLHEDIGRGPGAMQFNHDALTALPNRTLAIDWLTRAIEQARSDARLTLMVLNLNRFKLINDSLGYLCGDQVLMHIAERIQQCVGPGDLVARIGADEFMVVLAERPDQPASDVADHIASQTSRPLVLQQRELPITASIGLTVFPDDGLTTTELLRNAETAMAHARQQGLHTAQRYTREMARLSSDRLAVESQLRHAVERAELQLHYQPIVDLQSSEVVAVEALLRWHSPELGTVPPDHFIPVAEETGLIIALGRWLIQQACRQAARWHRQGRSLRVAINISCRQFVGGHIVHAVEAALRQHQLPAHLLELELTEGLLLDDTPHPQHALEQLKNLGVRLVLDDFGTGYSSLSYLRRYPFDAIKIDRSFIHDLDHYPETAALTRAIIAIGHSLGMEVVGEGIEEPGQIRFLQHHGCQLGQGYLLGRPQPAAGLEALLEQWSPSRIQSLKH